MSYAALKVDPLTGAYNVTEDTLRRFRAALGKAIAGTGDCNIAFIGDSTMAGGTDRRVAVSKHLRDLLSARGYKIKGTGYVPISSNPADQRYTASGYTLGAASGNAGSSTALTPGQSITFTPLTAATNIGMGLADPAHDTFQFYYHRNASGGQLGYAIDGGTRTDVSTSGTNALVLVTATAGSVGNHAITISNSGASNNVIISHPGVQAYNSTINGINVHNHSQSGATSTYFNSLTLFQAVFDVLTGTTPALTIDCFGINDANTNVAVATYQTNKLAFRNYVNSQGSDLLGMVPFAANISPTAGMAAYNAVDYTLADAANYGLVDFNKRWQSWQTSTNVGTQFDNLHPNTAGYADAARALVEALRL